MDIASPALSLSCQSQANYSWFWLNLFCSGMYLGTAWSCPQVKSTPSVLSPRSDSSSVETLLKRLAWRSTRFFLAALPKCLEFAIFFVYSIQVADEWRRGKEGELKKEEFIFSWSGKKQEKEGDSFFFVHTKDRKSWGKASSWEESCLFWTSVLWWGSCVSTVSGHFQPYFAVLNFQLCKIHCRVTFSFHMCLLHTLKFNNKGLCSF